MVLPTTLPYIFDSIVNTATQSAPPLFKKESLKQPDDLIEYHFF